MRKCKYLMTLLLVMVLCFTSIPAYAAEVTETEESTVEDLQETEAVTEELAVPETDAVTEETAALETEAVTEDITVPETEGEAVPAWAEGEALPAESDAEAAPVKPEAESVLVPIDEEPAVGPDKAMPKPDAGINAEVDSGYCGSSLTWKFFDDGILQISGSGQMQDFASGGAPWYEYASQITLLRFYNPTLTTIGNYAFYGCFNLKLERTSLPSSLTKIGDCAFLSCYKITDVVIPSSVTSIGRQAFGYCKGLKHVTVCGAPSLANWAIGDCTGLEEISFLGNAPSFESSVFGGSAAAKAWYPPDNSTWTSSVRQNYGGTITWTAGYHGWVGDNIYWDFNPDFGELKLTGTGSTWNYVDGFYPGFRPLSSKITWINITQGITNLNQLTFARLTNVTSVNLPDGLKIIGNNAFNSNSSLDFINIPGGLDKIDASAFSGCSKLTEIMFRGHAPASIHESAFKGITATVDYYPVYSWTIETYGSDYGGDITWNCMNECGIKDGNNATWRLYEDGTLAVYGTGVTDNYGGYRSGFSYFRDEIKTITVNDGITELGENFFEALAAVETVNLPDTLETIGDQTFLGCTSLASIEIPRSVKTVGANVFSGCSSLKTVRFMGHAPVIDNYAFRNVSTTAEYYPVYSWTSEMRQQYGGKVTWKCNNACGENGSNVTWSLDASDTLTMTGKGATEVLKWVPDDYSYFAFRDEIRSIVVREGITNLNDYCLQAMENVTVIRLPSTLQRIGTSTLYKCSKLTNITIPASVTEIGVIAFGACSNLEKVYFLGAAPDIGDSCFKGDTAYAYYPANDSTWTETVKQQYDGKITWTPSIYMTFGADKISAKLPVKGKMKLIGLTSNEPVESTFWTSSDSSIAGIDKSDYVTAWKYGKTTITASMGGGYYTAECELQTLFWDVAGSPDKNDPDYQYFYNPVYWAAEHKPYAITRGYDLEYFGVGMECERQDFTLFLYRLKGQPAPNATVLANLDKTFSDVSGLSETFRKAIAWAYGQGIIKGYTSGPNVGKFGNGLLITRREAMIMLWRYAGKPAPSAAGLQSARSFTDVKGIYKETTDSFKAIAWAAGAGIANGYTSAASLPPGSGLTVPCYGCDLPCLREQMITFLYRYAK